MASNLQFGDPASIAERDKAGENDHPCKTCEGTGTVKAHVYCEEPVACKCSVHVICADCRCCDGTGFVA